MKAGKYKAVYLTEAGVSMLPGEALSVTELAYPRFLDRYGLKKPAGIDPYGTDKRDSRDAIAIAFDVPKQISETTKEIQEGFKDIWWNASGNQIKLTLGTLTKREIVSSEGFPWEVLVILGPLSSIIGPLGWVGGSILTGLGLFGSGLEDTLDTLVDAIGSFLNEPVGWLLTGLIVYGLIKKE